MPAPIADNQPRPLTLLPQSGKWKGFAIRVSILFAALTLFVAYMIVMPGKSYSGPAAEPTLDELQSAVNLRKHVTRLATTIGERNLDRYKNLQAAAEYIETSFKSLGYAPQEQEFKAEGLSAKNIFVEIPGTHSPSEIVVVGAHYDSALGGTPGADDNATGVASALVLAKHFARTPHALPIRIVLFANEEQPYYHDGTMGSLQHAAGCVGTGHRSDLLAVDGHEPFARGRHAAGRSARWRRRGRRSCRLAGVGARIPHRDHVLAGLAADLQDLLPDLVVRD